MRKIPVGATISHAYRFAFGNVLQVFKAIWLPLLAQLAVGLLLTRRMAVFMTAMQAHDPSAVSLFGPLLLLIPLVLIFFFAQLTAATETALGRPPQTWFAFHFDRPMWRLLGGYLFAALALAAAALVMLLLFFLLTTFLSILLKSMPNSRTVGAVLAVLFMTAYVCVLALLSLRFLFLLAPINVAEQRLGVRQAWELSFGNFWRILLIVIAITLPLLIIHYAFTFALAGLPPMMPGATKEAREAADMAWRIRELNIMADRWYLSLPLTGLLMLFQFGLACSAQVFAWRALTQKDASAPVAGG